jgi:hypothetical protein
MCPLVVLLSEGSQTGEQLMQENTRDASLGSIKEFACGASLLVAVYMPECQWTEGARLCQPRQGSSVCDGRIHESSLVEAQRRPEGDRRIHAVLRANRRAKVDSRWCEVL